MEKLVDAIKDGEIVTVSEQQAREEELFILRSHEKKDPIEELPSIESRRRVSKPVPHVKSLSKWHSYEPEYKKNNVARELVDNFHWQIGKARRERNLTRLQLANALNIPEPALKMIENGELPSDDFVIINKIQQYLGLNLRRDGKTFEAPVPASKSVGPAYVAKPDFKRADLSLSDLQKMKETRDKTKSEKPQSKDSLSGDDIELFE